MSSETVGLVQHEQTTTRSAYQCGRQGLDMKTIETNINLLPLPVHLFVVLLEVMLCPVLAV